MTGNAGQNDGHLKVGKLEANIFKNSSVKIETFNVGSKEKKYTSEEIDEFKLKLQKYYQSKPYTKVQLLGDEDEQQSFTLENIFVNLVIVKEEEQRNEEYEKLSSTKREAVKNEERSLGLLNTYEDINRAKQPIELDDLFTSRKIPKKLPDGSTETEIKKILLLGRAGIGKSTLCRYLAYRWAKSELLAKFDWIFHIELKQLVNDFPREHAANKTLWHVLHHYYWKQQGLSEQDAQQVWSAIQARGKSVLFLLDGYDEVAHLQHPLIEDILLKQEYTLLTSRPYAIQTKRSDVNEVLENIGLLPQDIQHYIDKYFAHRYPNLTAKQQINEWLSKQAAVHSMCTIPLYLELLCSVWVTEGIKLEAKGQALQLIDLYNILVQKLLKRMLGKINSSSLKSYQEMDEAALYQDPDVIIARSYLANLAFEALTQEDGRLLIPGKVVITIRDLQRKEVVRDNAGNMIVLPNYNWELYKDELRQKIKSPTLIEAILKAGFLKNIGDSEDISKNSYYFLHLSFQEYFAALYISWNLEAHKDFIANYKYDPSWQLVWTLVAGLLKNNGPKLNRFFTQLLEEPRDLWGQYEAVLLAECLEACEWSKKLGMGSRQLLVQHLYDWIVKSFEKGERAPIISTFTQLPHTIKELGVEKLFVQESQPNGKRRKIALEVLGNLQNPSLEVVKALLQGYQDKERFVREAAQAALGKLQNLNVEAIAALLQRCQDKEESVRGVVLTALGNLQNPSLEVVKALLQGCQDKEESVCRAALAALDKIQNFNVEAIAVLLQRCQDKEESVRGVILTALGNLQNPSLEVVKALLQGCQDKEGSVRRAALAALSRLQNPSGEVIAALLQGCQDKEVSVRGIARGALGRLQNPSGEVMAALLQSCQNKVWSIRWAAREALGNLQNPSVDIIAALLQGCQDKEASVRGAALTVLGNLRNRSGEAITALLQGCQDKEASVRGAALTVLGNLRNPSGEAITALLQGCQDNERLVRKAALDALGKLQNPSREVIAALLQRCQDREWFVRRIALAALSRLQNPSGEVIAALLQGCQDKEEFARGAALIALGNLQNPSSEVIAALLQGYQNKEESVRWAALTVLGKLQNPSGEIIAALLQGCRDKEKPIREVALAALSNLQNPNGEAIAALLQGSQDKEESVRRRALVALGKLQNPSGEVIAALLQGCQDKKKSIREAALAALGKLQNPNGEVIASLLQGCQDKKEPIRETALAVLGKLQNPSGEVIAALLQGCQDKEESVRRRALVALGKLQNPSEEAIAALLRGCQYKDGSVRAAALTALGNLQNPSGEVIAAFLEGCQDKERFVRKTAESVLSLALLCQYYPQDEIQQQIANKILNERLHEYLLSFTQSSNGSFQCFVEKKRIPISSTNPEQFKVALIGLRLVPLLSLNFKQIEHPAASMQNVGSSTSALFLQGYRPSRTTGMEEVRVEQQPAEVTPSSSVANSLTNRVSLLKKEE